MRVYDVAVEVLKRLTAAADRSIWITRVTNEALLARAAELDRMGPSADLPLFGIPFAVKDNIDVAAFPTTAACPEFAYMPKVDATVVRKLLDAGAMCVGKTNLDQFATGLNGTRSPYGAPRCVFNSRYISGGSSSGSAVAVASELVSFALGTDTAGSGRVPASFNNLVGLKPTKGLLSTTGVVPACRSLDCVSIFTKTISDARTVLNVAGGFDAVDVFSRRRPPSVVPIPKSFRFGVPQDGQLKFFGDGAAHDLYLASLQRLRAIGGEPVTIDYSPFDETALLLYGGAFVAERTAAVGAFLDANPGVGHPVVRRIVDTGKDFSARDAFIDSYRLAALRRRTDVTWDQVDLLALPTAGTIYTVDQMLADPITLNSNLGYYTNFVNLFDLSALAVPAGFRETGLPFGITFIAPAWHDEALCEFGLRYALPSTL